MPEETRKRAHSEEPEQEDSSELPQEEIDVDFGFKDIHPKIDYQAIKTLLNQMLGQPDVKQLHAVHMGCIEELADIIIQDRELIGTCIKAEEEGEEEQQKEPESVADAADPLALFTVINLTRHQHHKAIQSFKNHILSKVTPGPFHDKLVELFQRSHQPDPKEASDIGFIVNERLINMPPQLFPPLLKLSIEEIDWAVEEGKPLNCEYYLMISKVYHEVEPTADEDDQGKKKKKKTLSTALCYQPEDELFHQFAEYSQDYKFNKTTSADSRRVFNEFGIEPSRRLVLIKRDVLKRVCDIVEQSFN